MEQRASSHFTTTILLSDDNWFGNYNGVATAYYIHTYNEANLKSVTFGKNGTTAGIEANIEAVESSFTAFSNDTVFGTYP